MKAIIQENFYLISIGLAIILVILLLVKNILINLASANDLHIEKASLIGKEEINEDYMDTAEASYGTLAVLADGFGKNETGRISGRAAVNTITQLFLEQWSGEKIEYFFNRAFNLANCEILKRIDGNQGGANVISAIIKEGELYYGLVGNAMIAVFRQGELFKLSEGHTVNVVAKKQFYKGKITKENALSALKEKKLLYYLGQEKLMDIEIIETPVVLQNGDIILLMSSGIYDSMPWTQLENIIGNNISFKNLGQEIVQGVKEKGTKSNGSIMLMKYAG